MTVDTLADEFACDGSHAVAWPNEKGMRDGARLPPGTFVAEALHHRMLDGHCDRERVKAVEAAVEMGLDAVAVAGRLDDLVAFEGGMIERFALAGRAQDDDAWFKCASARLEMLESVVSNARFAVCERFGDACGRMISTHEDELKFWKAEVGREKAEMRDRFAKAAERRLAFYETQRDRKVKSIVARVMGGK